MKLFKSKKTEIIRFLEVGCAVIREGDKILIARRRACDTLGGLWEFPGGKRIAAESFGACLERELYEELALRVRPKRFLRRIDFRYPERAVSLYFYECELVEGHPRPQGCEEFRWVRPFELKRFQFPPADEAILEDIRFGRV